MNINLKWVNDLIAFVGYKHKGTKNLDTRSSSKNESQGQGYFLKEKERFPVSLFSANYAPEFKFLICRISYLRAWLYHLFLVVVTEYDIPTVVYKIKSRYLLKYILPLHLL